MTADYGLRNLAAWSAQAAILISAAGLAAWVFRLRLPRFRLAYWQALLAICLMLPVVEPWRNPPDSSVEITTGPARAIAAPRAASYSLPWREALLAALALGCLGRTIWLAAGFRKLRRWRRQASVFTPVPHIDAQRAAIAPQAEFQLSASVSGPVTFGLWKPVILLPEHFCELSEDVQAAIACHELLHVRRHDWIVTLIEQAVRALLWFHPAIGWLTGQAQLAREQIVDAEVVARTGNREQYLNALLAIAGSRPVLDLAPAALFLRKRHLKNRVTLLLMEVRMSKRRIASFCAASCGLLIAAGWLALHTFPLQAAPVPQDSASSNLLHSVPPKYPEAARVKHIEGDVVIEAHIDAQGRVADAKVLSGPEELRNAALTAILQWHYSPQAMSLPAVTQVTINFTLPKDGSPEIAEDTPSLPAVTQATINFTMPKDGSPEIAEDTPSLPPGKPITVKSISVEGLTPASRDALLRQLTVHEGDSLDNDALHTLVTIVHAFDEHLAVSTNINGDNSGAIRIYLRPAQESAPPQSAAVGVSRDRIKIGSAVQQKKLLVKVTPVYPVAAKEQRIQGVVQLRAVIGKDGSVENLELLDGDPMLAAAAMDAVRQWKYETTLLNGNPVEVVTEIRVNFTLSQ